MSGGGVNVLHQKYIQLIVKNYSEETG